MLFFIFFLVALPGLRWVRSMIGERCGRTLASGAAWRLNAPRLYFGNIVCAKIAIFFNNTAYLRLFINLCDAKKAAPVAIATAQPLRVCVSASRPGGGSHSICQRTATLLTATEPSACFTLLMYIPLRGSATRRPCMSKYSHATAGLSASTDPTPSLSA